MLIRIVKMNFQEEEIHNFEALFEKKKQYIRNFEGCQFLELYQDRENKSIFFTYSYWESDEALQKYRHSELFKSVWAKTKPLFIEKAEAWSVDSMIKLP